MLWLLELEVFGENEVRLAETARRVGHRVTAWSEGRRARVEVQEPVVFHGSLEEGTRSRGDRHGSPSMISP